MSSQFTRQCLERIVAQICSSIGWDSVTQSCYEILVDILHNHMKMLCNLLHARAEACNRTEPGLLDVNYYIHTSNIFDIYRLGEYIRDVHIPPALPNLAPYPVKLNEDKTDLPPLKSKETTKKPPPAEPTTSNIISTETPSDEIPHSTNPERKDEVLFAEVNTNQFLRIVLYVNKHVLTLAPRNSDNEVDSTEVVKEVPKEVPQEVPQEAPIKPDCFEFKRPKTPKSSSKKQAKNKIPNLPIADSFVKKELLNEVDYQSTQSPEVDKSLNPKKPCKKERKTNRSAGLVPEIKQEVLDMYEEQKPKVEVEESHEISPPAKKIKRARKSKKSSVESLAINPDFGEGIKQEVFDDFSRPEELHSTVPVVKNVKKSRKSIKKEQPLVSNDFPDIKKEIKHEVIDGTYEINQPTQDLRKADRQSSKKGQKIKKNCKKEPLPIDPIIGDDFLNGNKKIKQEPLDETYEIQTPIKSQPKTIKKTKKNVKQKSNNSTLVKQEIKQEPFDDFYPIKKPKLEPEESHKINPYAKKSKRVKKTNAKSSAESLILNNAAVLGKKIKQELLDDIVDIKPEPEELYKVNNPYVAKKRSKKIKYSVKSLLTENKLILKRLK